MRPAATRLLAELLPRLRIDLKGRGSLRPAELFAPPRESYWLEIGFGGGEHLVALAGMHPEIGFLGAEPFLNGVAKLVTSVSQTKLGNVRIFDGDARILIRHIETASLDRVFILFPDPWPKARHAKRRLINETTLKEIHRILKPEGELRLASDSRQLVRWILSQIRSHGGFAWLANCASDWRDRPLDWPATRYEAKALKSGRVPTYLRFRRLSPD